MKKSILLLLFAFIVCLPLEAQSAPGNTQNESFHKAKRTLEREVYFDHRSTFYCLAFFDENGKVRLPEGFSTPKHSTRATCMEWEHVVPAENFGRTFQEWREGDPQCVDRRGAAFRGRKCAEKVNHEYRLMQSDMHNLVPAIGAVNAMRDNYNFQYLSGKDVITFGSCPVKIEGNKVEPPVYTKGAIARTYKYMAFAYPRYHMSKQQSRLMNQWDKDFTVDKWECTRERRIERIQGNSNPFVRDQCIENGL